MNEKDLELLKIDCKDFDSMSKNYPTVEYTIEIKNLKEFIEQTKGLSSTGMWIYFDCDTCKNQHGNEVVHASLVKKHILDGVI